RPPRPRPPREGPRPTRSSRRWREPANWGLLIGGAVVEVAAGSFLVIACTTSIVRVSFIVTGVIMAASGLLLLRLGWGNDDEAEDDQRISANGGRGRATLEAVQPTTLGVHKRPELRMQLSLQLAGRRPHLAPPTGAVAESVA